MWQSQTIIWWKTICKHKCKKDNKLYKQIQTTELEESPKTKNFIKRAESIPTKPHHKIITLMAQEETNYTEKFIKCKRQGTKLKIQKQKRTHNQQRQRGKEFQ